MLGIYPNIDTAMSTPTAHAADFSFWVLHTGRLFGAICFREAGRTGGLCE